MHRITASLITSASLIAAAPSSAAFGPREVPLYGITSDGQLVLIDIETAATTPLYQIGFSGSMTFDRDDGVLAIANFLSEPQQLIISDPTTQTVAAPVPITGFPAGEENTGGIGYLGTIGELIITFGPSGTLLEDRIAQIGHDGIVVDTSADLLIGDNDGIAWDEANQQLLVHDFNAVDGLPELAIVNDVFGTPTWDAFALLPTNDDVWNPSIHPIDGRVFAIEFDDASGKLVEIVGNQYLPIGSFDTPSEMFGLAFTAIPTCSGDVDSNGDVGLSDLIAVLGAWGPCPDCVVDFDNDGLVGIGDLLVVLAGWGPCL